MVKVESEPDHGTVVTLLLPRSDAVPAAADDLIGLDSTIRRRALKGTILLVEDDNEVAALVSEMLSELGYRTTRAASAQAALGALADDREISLVLSDVMMPGSMNGLQLAQEIHRRRPDMPVLLTTGYAGAAVTEAQATRLDMLSKPYQLSDLDAAVRSALSRISH
jgi:DNA-binding NtrC family response regulator